MTGSSWTGGTATTATGKMEQEAAPIEDRETENPIPECEGKAREPDRFEAARGRADIRWRTDELMALLRGRD